MNTILGLNCNHADSSACIIKNGKLLIAIEEERINREKHWAGLPVNSIEQCLKIKNSKTIVSTDDKKIAEIANENGAETPFFRHKEFINFS